MMNYCIFLPPPYFQRLSAINNDRSLNNDCLRLKMFKPMTESTSIHEIGYISANNGLILKIQNLSYSAERSRPDQT